MFHSEHSIVIDAAVEEVFAYASDWRKWHEWFEGVSNFIPVTEAKKGTGTRYAYKTSIMGIRIPVETEIHDYVENKGWNGVSTKGAPHRTHWRFESIGNRTRFTYGLEGHLPIPVVGTLMDRILLQSHWDRIISNSQANLKRNLESDHQPAPSTNSWKNRVKLFLLVAAGILSIYWVNGCNKCDDGPGITSFMFEELTPPVRGNINHEEHTIQVTVPESTDLSNLVPTISVANEECHTLSPPSGQRQDFTEPVFYQVKNEAGRMYQYEVTAAFKIPERYASDSLTILWTTGSEMPVPTGWAASAVLNQKIYVLGGATDDRILTDLLQVYDPATDRWDKSLSPPKYMRFAHGAAAVNGKIYVFGGALTYPGPVYDNIQVYDPVTDIWKDQGTMSSARAAFATVAYEGKIYLMGGETNEPTALAEILDLVQVYDPEENTWETLAPMPSPRAYHSACVVNGKIYAIGGVYKLPFPGLTMIEEYDPLSDTWKEKTPLKLGRYSLSTCVVDGKIFCIGGNPLDLAANGSTTVEVYDPATDSVFPATEMEFVRYTAASAAVDGKIYILGGCNDAHYNTYSNKTEIGIPELD